MQNIFTNDAFASETLDNLAEFEISSMPQTIRRHRKINRRNCLSTVTIRLSTGLLLYVKNNSNSMLVYNCIKCRPNNVIVRHIQGLI